MDLSVLVLFLLLPLAFSERPRKKKPIEINVIIFFVGNNSTPPCDQEQDQGIKYLQFRKAATIKPCTPEKEADVGGDFARILRYSQNSCDCKELLKTSLMSLIGYARNTMGLTTAVSSLTETERDVNPANGISESDTMVEGGSGFKEKSHSPHINSILKLEEDLASQKKQYEENFLKHPIATTKGDSAVLYLKPPSSNYKGGKLKRALMVPENTEVFDVAPLENSKGEEPREIRDIPLLQNKPKSLWDTLGIMSGIRQSFFDQFFNPMFDPEKRFTDEEEGLNINLIGQVKEPSMFELVRRTLRQVEQKDSNGYLMTIMGGDLCQIREPRSDLVQSIKHVLENSCPDDTLVAVTGSCPTDGKAETDVDEMPLYVKGPESELFSKARELYDVPKIAHTAMKQHHKKKKRTSTTTAAPLLSLNVK